MFRYLFVRFRLHTQGSACALIFACCFGLFERLATGGDPAATAFTGAATFVLFFLLLRLADDLEDRETGAAHERRRLLAGVVLTLATIFVLNLSDGRLLAAALIGSAAVFLPAFAKHRGLSSRPLLALVYEVVPALFLGYVYFAWLFSTAHELALLPAAAAILMFWSAYEFWKLTRKLGAGEVMQPYYLGPLGLRVAALSMLALALVSHVVVLIHARWSLPFSGFLIGLPILFVIFLLVRWPTGWNGKDAWRGPGSRLAWRGLVYPLVLSVGTLIEVIR